MTSAEVAALDSPVLLVPVGSFEQHGPHLPLDTDTRIAVELAGQARERLARTTEIVTVISPPITVSASGEHQGFAGTLSIGTDVTSSVLVEIARSADWARGVVFVNGHGGNAEALDRARRLFIREQRHVLIWSPAARADDDAHAGRTETSVMAHLSPEAVDWERVTVGRTTPIAELVDDLRRHGVRAVSDNGILGDPSGASAEHGRVVFDRWCTELVAAIVDWDTTRDPTS
jgi:mycofactocin system creatininase family protein